MEFPFPINRPATGTDFLSRGREAGILAGNILFRRHTLIYDAPNTGKHSLVHNALSILERDGHRFTIIYLNLYRSRSLDEILRHYADAVIKAFTPSEEEQVAFTAEYFHDTPDRTQILSVPEIIGRDRGDDIIVWLDEFQNILCFDDPGSALKTLEEALLPHKHVTYLITGSKINAMKHIFEDIGCFFNFAERLVMPPLSEDDVSYHITKVFQKVGRVISRQLTKEIYDCAQGNPWIAWQLSDICFNLTRGYVTADIIGVAVSTLLKAHETEFHDIIDSLSNYQLQLLRAVFNGETRINSQDVIDRYCLSSSANVHRLKEALIKKEVITFDSEYRPRIINPLFHLWLSHSYFTEQP